jgi:hypothetical protein
MMELAKVPLTATTATAALAFTISGVLMGKAYRD